MLLDIRINPISSAIPRHLTDNHKPLQDKSLRLAYLTSLLNSMQGCKVGEPPMRIRSAMTGVPATSTGTDFPSFQNDNLAWSLGGFEERVRDHRTYAVQRLTLKSLKTYRTSHYQLSLHLRFPEGHHLSRYLAKGDLERFSAILTERPGAPVSVDEV